MLTVITVIVLAYLAGSLPFAWLLTRGRGIDLRRVGSRNLGASNVLRTAGLGPAILVMLGDAAKGAIAVSVTQTVLHDLVVTCAAGVAAIIGHVYPVWFKFRGGKGVATAAGVFAVLVPAATAAAVLAFAITVILSRFVSAGSIVASIVLPLATMMRPTPAAIVVATIAAAVIIMSRHRDNLTRLLRGTERRIGMKA